MATRPWHETQKPYAGCSELAGPPADAAPDVVMFRPTVTGAQRRTLRALVAATMGAEFLFVGWLLAPAHWVALLDGGPGSALALAAFGAIALVELNRLVQALALSVFSLAARDPVPLRPPTGVRVAVLTTIVPSREPVALVEETLAAMRRLEVDGCSVDVWILDEGDDEEVRRVAATLGVRHFSRRPYPELNTERGAFRARTKAGNHNAWLRTHGDGYDLVAQLDPDHVPLPSFLSRTLGYFRDPDVAFVVAPQVYGRRQGLISHGAAVQAYVFHGVVQRGGNGLGAPLLIGTNHVYRTAAWRQIGGYQDSIIEDHLTSMTVQGVTNPRTGNTWTGVYTPDVLAVGQAPSTWTDFFGQQRRWTYGVCEIVLHHARRLGRRLTPRQRLAYALLQSFYPGVALTWIAGTAATLTYLLGLAEPPDLGAAWPALWAASWATLLALFLWLRRFNIAEHERRELGLPGALITLCTGPVYVAALLGSLLGRPLAYHVTSKGPACRPDRPGAFRLHLAWLAAVGIALLASWPLGGAFVPRCWALVTILASALPPASWAVASFRSGAGGRVLEALELPRPVMARVVAADHEDRVPHHRGAKASPPG
jgi:cellulose synthase (UDP-forming)